MTKQTEPVAQAECITQIARQYLCSATLETRDRGELDFHDVGVWNVKAALEAAYAAGRQSATAK